MSLLLLILTMLLGWSSLASGHHRPPIVTISAPTTSATYTTLERTVTLSGTAQGRHRADVLHVRWQTSTGASGTAAGTRQWQVTLSLAAPTTTVTIIATDTNGATGQDA